MLSPDMTCTCHDQFMEPRKHHADCLTCKKRKVHSVGHPFTKDVEHCTIVFHFNHWFSSKIKQAQTSIHGRAYMVGSEYVSGMISKPHWSNCYARTSLARGKPSVLDNVNHFMAFNQFIKIKKVKKKTRFREQKKHSTIKKIECRLLHIKILEKPYNIYCHFVFSFFEGFKLTL